jgi:hypothetical protein
MIVSHSIDKALRISPEIFACLDTYHQTLAQVLSERGEVVIDSPREERT